MSEQEEKEYVKPVYEKFYVEKASHIKELLNLEKSEISPACKEEVEKEEIKLCSWCQEPTEKLFYNYKNMPLCKECLDRILKETRKTLNYVRNFVSA